ncbi:YfcC family protein [Pseudobacillus wudalianchiensis]|uniref:C4-dicarboxylate ABC transporter permease n=1 Tax=Pseudobacillus wudalianchiensis TaxID=1743143 RepID=A0A1B9B6S1_9BACI|nr:YfcC family protein [Bacillus wudalianchiensis]OCA91794.1 C4-dicarboxylate ABC transporter permease [Bacillus wudalianchiensis]
MNTAKQLKKVESSATNNKKKGGLSAYVLMFFIIAVLTLLTYVVPAGKYERYEENGRTMIDPAKFEFVKNTPVGLLDMFNAFHQGMVNAAPIILFVLLFGGALGMMQATGAIDALIRFTVQKFGAKKKLIIPVMVLIFSLLGTLIGSAEDSLVYIAIIVPMTIALGFDALTGLAIVFLGMLGAGFTAGITNPFTIGVAQTVAELPMYSGIGLRIAIYVVFYILSVVYIMRHVNKIEKNPELAVYGKFNPNDSIQFDNDYKLNKKHAISLFVFLGCFVALIYGVISLGWYISEIVGVFLLGAIIMGLIGKLSGNEMTDAFLKGCSEMIPGAMIIGVANTILVVLTAGGLLDTILYSASGLLDGLPPSITAIGIAVVNFFIHFLVPSGSGHASLVMPIMAPLADLVGVTRQTTAFATVMGGGVSNLIIPTGGLLLAALGMMGIPYAQWVKWVLPYVLIQVAVVLIFLVIAQAINYGPF